MHQSTTPRRIVAALRRAGLTVIFVGALLHHAPGAMAVERAPAPAAPQEVLLSPGGALLEVEETVSVSTADGVSSLVFALPGGADNLQLSVPGQTVARWATTPMAVERSGDQTRLREEALHASAVTAGRLAEITARLALWEGSTQGFCFQEMAQREAHMREAIADLSVEKTDLERRLALLRQQIEQLPASPELGKLVTVTLHKAADNTKQARVRYSYTLRNCGWRPVYSFNALPGKGQGDETEVRLMAEVWQYSGLNWQNARLTLVSRGEGPREAASLPRWVVDSQGRPVPAPGAVPRKTASLMFMEEGKADASVAGNAAIRNDTDAVYATWTLEAQGLPEGRARLLIAEDVWKAPLQWLARPREGDSRVWLMTRAALPPVRVWPEGAADFRVEGQSVGQGFFSPRGAEATLYFGPDPRVQARVVVDAQKRGESGFIGKNRTWTWGWTYVLTNSHTRAVKVRVERPMPMIVDEGVSVTYNDAPRAERDEKEHTLLWNTDVPAGGKAEIKHVVTITAPKDMPLSPDAP